MRTLSRSWRVPISIPLRPHRPKHSRWGPLREWAYCCSDSETEGAVGEGV